MAKKKTVPKYTDEAIINKIYIFRGLRVMLDKDLAELYGVETKVFNQAVWKNHFRRCKQVSLSSYISALFSVFGTIVRKQLILTKQNWADYIFNPGYQLRSLESLEKCIALNKHLPNVPSANEIEMDGLNLGEFNKIQMEKIEELTLYFIELKKELNELKKKSGKNKCIKLHSKKLHELSERYNEKN